MDLGEITIDKSLNLLEEMIKQGVPVESNGFPKQWYTVYITNKKDTYYIKRHRNKRN